MFKDLIFLKMKFNFPTFIFTLLILLFIFYLNSNSFINGMNIKNNKKGKILREAMFYKKLNNNSVECSLCYRNCIISDGKRGVCRNKENRNGILYNIVYSMPSAIQIDPVEKEPQLHMLPGTYILCFGTAGCNFRCKHCHNWHLSQKSIEEIGFIDYITPEDAVNIAISKKIPTISFTYNEPTSFYEYVYDIAKIAKEKGVKILWHSNGAINPEPLKALLKYTDAVTIDLKGFSEEVYQKMASAKLAPVLETLKIIKKENVWLEIVNLVIPGLNDNPHDIKKMCEWIRDNLGNDVPIHFSRFFPSYKLLDVSATPIKTLENAYKIAKEVGLNYVTLGNVPGHKYNSTFCPKCGKIVIKRTHFEVVSNNVINGKCKFCNHKIPGIWR